VIVAGARIPSADRPWVEWPYGSVYLARSGEYAILHGSHTVFLRPRIVLVRLREGPVFHFAHLLDEPRQIALVGCSLNDEEVGSRYEILYDSKNESGQRIRVAPRGGWAILLMSARG
jgi:hypothetical protein